VVVGEIAILPLVFGEVWVAVVFTVLNAAVLTLRIRQENEALAARRVRGTESGAGMPTAKG
jgi:methyltransferase